MTFTNFAASGSASGLGASGAAPSSLAPETGGLDQFKLAPVASSLDEFKLPQGSLDQFKLAPEGPPKKKSILARLSDIIREENSRFVGKAEAAVDAMGRTQTGAESVFQTGAAAAGSGARIVSRSAIELIKSLIPDDIEESIKESMARELAESDIPKIAEYLKPKVDAFVAAHPRATRNLTAGVDILEAASTIELGNKVEGWLKENVPKAASAISEKAKGLVSNSDWVKNRETERALLEAGTPDSRVATKMLDDGIGGPGAQSKPRIVADKAAKEIIKQGVPEAETALIKNASKVDKNAMRDMLDTRVAQTTNLRLTDRAADRVGETFFDDIAKPLETINKSAQAQLDDVAEGLVGQTVALDDAAASFTDDLAKARVKVTPDGLDFSGSDFDGLAGPQNAIEKAWTRLNAIGDARDAHGLKRYIDEIVSYGENAEGLKGHAETMLKTLRHNVDTVLDATSSDYNAVNSVYSQSITALDDLRDAVGSGMDLKGGFGAAGVGTKFRGLFANTQGRAQLLQALDTAQKTLENLGLSVGSDIVTQAKFADVLETFFGSEAPASFMGQIEKAGNIVAGGAQIASGHPTGIVSGAIKVGSVAANAVRGINQKNLIKALYAILK